MKSDVRYMTFVYERVTEETRKADHPLFIGHWDKRRAVIDAERYTKEEEEAAEAEQRPVLRRFFVVKATTTFKEEPTARLPAP
jgi:hypothetical protein